MSDMDEFFTREIANEGRKVDLVHPDGTPSEHWIQIRGMDADAFKSAETKAKRKAVEIAQIDDEDNRVAAVAEVELQTIASLVAGWSFEQECSPKAIVKFLREAPQIAEMVNRYAARRSLFFGKESNSSASGSSQKSD